MTLVALKAASVNDVALTLTFSKPMTVGVAVTAAVAAMFSVSTSFELESMTTSVVPYVALVALTTSLDAVPEIASAPVVRDLVYPRRKPLIFILNFATNSPIYETTYRPPNPTSGVTTHPAGAASAYSI